MSIDLTNPIFSNEDKARKHLEAIRWPDGPYCPFCGQLETVKGLPPKGSMGKGWYHCRECRKKFTVRVGTVYERSKVPLHKWVLATHLLCASKKGMSAHQLHRMLGVTYKTAWFMAHRIREGMRPNTTSGQLGGRGKTVEGDETYVGGKESNKHLSKRNSKNIGGQGKAIVFSLVERKGFVRSQVVQSVNAKTLGAIVNQQVSRQSSLMSDDAGQWRKIGRHFAGREIVNHSAKEYVRGDAHTNTVEGYFSILKRGIGGVYHHVSEQHLKRYLGEFDFRYNNRAALKVSDTERAEKALKGITGKRLTYRRPDASA